MAVALGRGEARFPHLDTVVLQIANTHGRAGNQSDQKKALEKRGSCGRHGMPALFIGAAD